MDRSMGTPLESGKSLLEMAEELAAQAASADRNSVEDRAGLLAALSEVTVLAKSTGASYVVDAARALTVIIDRHDPDDSASITEGIAKLLEAAGGGSPAPDLPAAPVPQPAAPPAWLADPELVSDFQMEAADHLATIETQLLRLEQEPASREVVNSIFRGFHTIKGLAGFLVFPAMQAVAHETETLLDLVRSGKRAATPGVIDVVLESADYLRRDLARVREMAAGAPPRNPAGNRALIDKVRARMLGEVSPESSPAAAPLPACEGILESAPVAAQEEARKAAPVEARLVKVDTAKLDFLVEMVGELVISQSLIRHDGSLNAAANPRLQRNLSQLARITADVQKTAMSMRMVPVGQLFQKAPRMVRDLTRKAGKRAELEIEGEETELDRTIVEQLGDPLMHMIRNSADHGIELPAEREAAGKPATAKIGLKAYHQSGHIVIEVRDDGRGLDRGKILKKAREKGLVQDGAALSDQEVFNLIFEAGFSTAETVTDVSGRGVGMDVVRRQVQKLRGGIDIQSTPGGGTTFFLKLPLTLAIIDGLVVNAAGQRYILPIYAVREIFRPKPETCFTVEGWDEMVLVRDRLLPVTRLNRCFADERQASPAFTELSNGVLVVAETAGRRFCLLVDQVLGKQEVVIRSLGETFKHLSGISGGAILGDGRVALILDLDTLEGATAHA